MLVSKKAVAFDFTRGEELEDMGKYMKKSKLAGDVAVKDVSQSALGVRTRAKTLALQRLQSAAPAKPDSCYLELRSRRLEKLPLLGQYMQHSQSFSSPKHCLNCRENGEFVIETLSSKAGSIGLEKEENACFEKQSTGFETVDLEIEASFGKSSLESEARERSTRESTPCSLTMAADTITTPGSNTKPVVLNPTNLRAQNIFLRNMPTDAEIEEFFAHAEQSQHRLFIEKYNFDIVNICPSLAATSGKNYPLNRRK